MKRVVWPLIGAMIFVALGAALLAPQGTASASGFAALATSKEADSYFRNGKLEEKRVEQINAGIKSVPDQLFELFGNDKINIYVTFSDGTAKEYWAFTHKSRLKEMRQGARNDASIEARVKEATIRRIISSKKPFDGFIAALDSGEIQYRGLTLEGKVKSGAVKFTTAIISAAKKISGLLEAKKGN